MISYYIFSASNRFTSFKNNNEDYLIIFKYISVTP